MDENTNVTKEKKRKENLAKYQAQYYAANKERISERKRKKRLEKRDELNKAQNERYKTDPLFRNKKKRSDANFLKKKKILLNAHPSLLEEHNAKRRAAKINPDYREKINKYQREYHKMRMSDPIYREKRREKQREYASKRNKHKSSNT